MLKENWRLISRLERLGDSILIAVCFVISYYGRNSLLFWDQLFGLELPFSGPSLAPIKDYFIVLLVAWVGYITSLSWLGAYGSMRLSSPWHLLRLSISSSLLVFLLLAAAMFLLKLDLSRSFIILFCLLVSLTLTAERFVVLQLLRFWRRRGRNYRNVLVCGLGDQALRLVQELSARPELGIRVRGFVDLLGGGSSAHIRSFREQIRHADGQISTRVLIGIAAAEKALKHLAIDEVIFTDVVEVMPQVREVVFVCAEEGVRTTIAADLFSVGLVKSGISYFGGMPLIHFQSPPGDHWELVVKRVVDVAVSGVLLLLFAPLFGLIAILVALTSPGPILYRQRRMGLNGRQFLLYKFRSMRIGADREIAALREKNEMRGPVFKLKNDPRVTPIGRILRRYSLDELPQLWNVFLGDMSLVGPRPPIPGEVSLYERRDRRRLSMRPGITCTWQVSGRSDIRDFDEWVKLDLEYIDNWSLSRDFSLMLRTIPAVIFGQGAR